MTLKCSMTCLGVWMFEVFPSSEYTAEGEIDWRNFPTYWYPWITDEILGYITGFQIQVRIITFRQSCCGFKLDGMVWTLSSIQPRGSMWGWASESRA